CSVTSSPTSNPAPKTPKTSPLPVDKDHRDTPPALATFRNLTLNTFRLAGRANIAHARRDLHDRTDTFAVYGI
ncbi:hypothetical protein ABZ807_31840, partial [Micromonospora sp. NPDC047548]